MNQNAIQSISLANPPIPFAPEWMSQIFNVANSLTLVAWIFLLLASRMKRREWVWIPLTWVGILCLTYTAFIASLLNSENLRNMGSLMGVMKLFTDPKSALIGWIHYFALDLAMGIWVTLDSIKRDRSRPLTSLALIASFFAGPVGLIFYAIFGVGFKGFQKTVKGS
jgi:hypothetical protein